PPNPGKSKVDRFLATAGAKPSSVIGAFTDVIEALRRMHPNHSDRTGAQVELIMMKDTLIQEPVDVSSYDTVMLWHSRLDVAITSFILSHGMEHGIEVRDTGELDKISAFLINNLVDLLGTMRETSPEHVAIADRKDMHVVLDAIGGYLSYLLEVQTGDAVEPHEEFDLFP
ncbi:MAG: hypothetical protein KDK11_14950, partial [Maritimibacter sp.]|nr:hypothetical protein [Maritimibacter sp.]